MGPRGEESTIGGANATPRSWLARLRDRDHTQGSLFASVIALSLPSILTSLAGMGAFQLVELEFLGRLGSDSVAAVGAANQVFRQAVMLVLVGLNAGSQMIIARAIGRGEVEEAERAAGQTFVLGIGLAAAAATVGFAFAEPLAALISGDSEIAALGAVYLRVLSLTFGVSIGVQLFGSILNGAGDTTTPMLVSLLIMPASIAAQWVLAFGNAGAPALGVAGIALGAALGGLCGLALAMWALFSGRCRVHLRARHLRPNAARLRALAAVAWQPAFHMIARTSIVMVFMVLAGTLGGEVQAAYTIGIRVEMLGIMVAFPVANACATLVGQNLGAGNPRRAKRALAASAAVSAAILWPAAVLIGVFRAEIVSVFSSDPEVVRMAAEYLLFSAVILAFYGFYFIAFRTLQAAGDMYSPMIISVSVAGLLGAPLGYVLVTYTDLGATGMWIANLAYSGVNAALMLGWLLRGNWLRR